MFVIIGLLLAIACGALPLAWSLGGRRAERRRALAEANAEGWKLKLEGVRQKVADQKGQIAALREAVEALQSSCQDDLIGKWALINDHGGDGYQGLVAAYDDKMVHLVSVGGRSAQFIDGATKHVENVEEHWLPAGQVKFVTGVT